MALKDFDISFTNKVKAWFSNTIYAPTDILYNVSFNLAEDTELKQNLKYPLIGIYRPSGLSQTNNQTFAARKRGIEYYHDSETGTRGYARFLSVNLPYQLDIYAKSPEQLDDITEQIMHAFSLDQKLEVDQFDSKNDIHYIESYDITYNTGPAEQSEFSNDDRIFHYSLAYDILNARILNFKDTPSISTVDTTVGIEVEEDE